MTTLLFRTARCSTAPASTRSLFKFPSLPFAAAASPKLTPKSPRVNAGQLRKVGKVWLYEEGRAMGHTPEQLYAVIADVDSYRSFLPFATSSHVLSAALRADPATPQPLPQQGWLKPPATPGETWDLEAELHVGAMGYSEGYVSRIELQKYSQVIATAKDSTLFKHLVTRWRLTPLPPSPTNAPRTQVDLSLAYAFASPFHAAAVSTVWEKVSGLMIEKFEHRVVEVYGKSS